MKMQEQEQVLGTLRDPWCCCYSWRQSMYLWSLLRDQPEMHCGLQQEQQLQQKTHRLQRWCSSEKPLHPMMMMMLSL